MANRFFLVVFYFFSVHVLHAQSLRVLCPDPVYDFGLVKETGGKVYHQFVFENSGTDTAFLEQVTVSCGCTDARMSHTRIAPGKKALLETAYDPLGRPGYFNKSVEVVFRNDTLFQRVLLMLRGNVLQREIIPESQTDRSSWRLILKPFRAELDGPFDDRFVTTPAFQDLANDLTYEIDKEGFTRVKLEVFTWQSPYRNDWNLVYAVVRKQLVHEMERRGYKSSQIFFESFPGVFSDEAMQRKTNLIKVSSLLYNNDFAEQSVLIAPTQAPVPDFEFLYRTALADSLGVIKEYNQPSEYNKLETTRSEMNDFVKQAVRYTLMQTGIDVQVSVVLREKDKMTGETWLKKKYPAICRQFTKLLEEEGIQESAIRFIVPVISADSVYGKLTMRLIRPGKTDAGKRIMDFEGYQSWLLSRQDSVSVESGEVNQGLYLPVYYQYFKRDVPFDTTDSYFKDWLNVLAVQLQKGKRLKFLIEASASNSPSSKGLANDYIARKRAKSTAQALVFALRQRGLKGSELTGLEFAYVHGPLYDEKSYLLKFYDKYQYVRIIPYEEKAADKKDFDAVKPYQVNFNTNSFRLPVNSPVFRSFIARSLALIKKYGYLEIILESSSSTTPTLDFKNNYVLSYERIQHTRDILRTEMLRNGIDPARLIIRQERALVQGPRYKPGQKVSPEILERYQYIKIIPFSGY